MNKKRTKIRFIQSATAFAFASIPLLTFGATGLVPCDGGGDNPCDFNQLIIMANNIIKFLLFDVAIPLAVLGFMFAGAMLVIGSNKEGEWTKAKERFENIGIGFFIILGSFIFVKLVLYSFLNTEAGFSAFLLQ